MFKRIDPSIVLSGTYSKWMPSVKSLYHTICSLADYKSGELFHSVNNLSDMAGISRRATQYALRELERQGIITTKQRSGRSPIIVYNFSKRIKTASPAQIDAHTRAADCAPPAQPVAHTRATGCTHNNIQHKYNKITISENLITKLIAKYGEQEVMERVVVISSLDEVENKEGLLVASLKSGYVPAASVKERKKQEVIERREAYQRKKEMHEYESHIENIRRESADPAVQERIRREIQKINSILEIE